MAKKIVKATIYGLKRDDQDWVPQVDTEQDFTDEEIRMIDEQSPGALVDPQDEADRLAAGGIRQVRQTSLDPGRVNENSDAGQGGSENSDNGTSATVSTPKSRAAAGGKEAGDLTGSTLSTDTATDADRGGSVADSLGGGTSLDEGQQNAAGKGSKSKGDDL